MRAHRNFRRSRRPGQRSGWVRLAGGALVVALLIGSGWVALNAGNGLPLVSYRTYYSTLANVGNLQPHDDVRTRGVRVGQVKRISVNDGKAELTLQLDSGGPIHAGTTVTVRGQGLLGQRYIQLNPGASARVLPNGASLAPAKVSLTFGIPDALNTFNTQTRGALGDALKQLGTGLTGEGDPINQALDVGPSTGRQFVQIADAILGRPGSADRLVPSLEAGTLALSDAMPELVRAVRSGVRAVEPFYDERPAMRDTLRALPSTLTAAQGGLTTGQQLLTAVHALVGAVNYTLPTAPKALRLTADLLHMAPPPLRGLNTVLHHVGPTVPAVLRITDALQPLLSPVKRAVSYLQDPVVILGQHGCDIANFASNWRSTLSEGVPAPSGGALMPSGRLGGLGLFRITVVANPNILQGTNVRDPHAFDTPYPAPCAYAPGPVYGGGL